MKTYKEFINENITLTEDEKKLFWSKIEYSKKKKAKESENDLFKLLTSSGNSSLTEEDFIKYLNNLEYTFKKNIKDTEKTSKNDIINSFKSKIPASFIGVKFSSINAKDKRNKKADL